MQDRAAAVDAGGRVEQEGFNLGVFGADFVLQGPLVVFEEFDVGF